MKTFVLRVRLQSENFPRTSEILQMYISCHVQERGPKRQLFKWKLERPNGKLPLKTIQRIETTKEIVISKEFDMTECLKGEKTTLKGQLWYKTLVSIDLSSGNLELYIWRTKVKIQPYMVDWFSCNFILGKHLLKDVNR